MSEERIATYDPDPTNLQLQSWGNINIEDLSADDLCNPQSVRMLVYMNRISVLEKKQLSKSNHELQTNISLLQSQVADLRVQVAGSQEKSKYTWLEIPVSFISGFAINLLSATPSSGIGWFMLIISLLILCFLRSEDLKAILREIRGQK